MVKINKWDGSAVKHALDDSFKKALLKHSNLKEQFGLIDGRLAICSLAVGIAGVALGYDYYYPFPQSRTCLIICVVTYFILMGALTLYTQYREKGIFAVATEKNGGDAVWQASSDMRKYDDKYTITLSVSDSKSTREMSSTKSCARFIDVNGNVLDDLVAQELNTLYNNIDKKGN